MNADMQYLVLAACGDEHISQIQAESQRVCLPYIPVWLRKPWCNVAARRLCILLITASLIVFITQLTHERIGLTPRRWALLVNSGCLAFGMLLFCILIWALNQAPPSCCTQSCSDVFLTYGQERVNALSNHIFSPGFYHMHSRVLLGLSGAFLHFIGGTADMEERRLGAKTTVREQARIDAHPGRNGRIYGAVPVSHTNISESRTVELAATGFRLRCLELGNADVGSVPSF